MNSLGSEQRLLGFLAHRLAAHPEDVATEALGFLLHRSPVMRTALSQLCQSAVEGLPALASFRTQVSDAERTRPDLVGFDADGQEVMLVEAKFWAGLTANQPVAYLERLRASDAPVGALIVVCPERRLESLWGELLGACRESALYGDVVAARPREQVRLARLTPGTSMALISWQYLLGTLMAEVSAEGDPLSVSDLLQLQSLAECEDVDAFLPLQAWELGPEFPRRMMNLRTLVDDLVVRAQLHGDLSTQGLRPGGGGNSYGRYVRLGHTGAWLGYSFEFWRDHAATPLWLQLQDWNADDPETLEQKRKRLQAYEFEVPSRLLVLPNESLLIPLKPPLGVERDGVLAALLAQLSQVRELLEA